MADHVTDEEQVLLLKVWWAQYGKSIIFGILLAVLMTTGYQYYQTKQSETLAKVSIQYAQLMIAVSEQNADNIAQLAGAIKTNYPKTTYATFSSLVLAREAVQYNKLADAATELTWVINHARDASLKQIARLRLARVQFSQGNASTALATLAQVNAPAFYSFAQEIRGDIYVTQGEREKARQAYTSVLADQTYGEALSFVQMKLDELGEAPVVVR